MLQQVICAALEKMINQALAFNLEGTTPLNALEGAVLTVSLEELSSPLTFIVNQQLISVISDDSSVSVCDCRIDTSVSTLMQLKENQQLTELIKQDKLDIQGDIKVAQQFLHVFEHLDIDWRSEIAKHIGDIPTYKLGQLAELIGAKLSFAKKQIQADASEWLVHEKRLVVTNGQLKTFNQAVEQVEQQTQLLTQRVDKLFSQLTANSQG